MTTDIATADRIFADFPRVYRGCIDDMLRLMPDDWSSFASHNTGWRKGLFDPRQYLTDSEIRYSHALRVLLRDGARSVLDVGGFLAVFPLALHRLGLEVAVAEKYGYYGNALDRVADHLVRNGVRVIDVDFTQPAAKLDDFAATFDAVTCMAVAEHLAHSPQALMWNIRSALKRGGTLVFEVPNLAFWPRRFAFFFRGKSVLAPIEDVYHSAVPFTGHHREYTLADARYVVHESGFRVLAEHTFNYSVDLGNLLQRLKYAPALLFKEWAEVILLHCRKPAQIG